MTAKFRKFRAKTEDTEEWVEGWYFVENQLGYLTHAITRYERLEGRNVHYIVDEDTIGQFTGLLDKKDNKIFAGDIVLDVKGDYYEVFFDDEKGMFLGRCVNETYMCADKEHQELGETTALYSGVEVVGNIIDNPELIYNEEEE